MTTKSPKELAFLNDLYVATDWGERFATLVDEHVQLPEEGRALYVAAGAGGHALALQVRAGENLKLLCVDQNEECLELARTKAVALHQETEFQREDLKMLSLADNEFDLVLGDASFIPHGDLKPMLAELVRVAKPGATVGWWLPTAASFGEVFSVYWEALHRAGLRDHSADVEKLITELPPVAVTEEWAEEAGLNSITSSTTFEEFDYDSGEEFLNSPLITDFLLPNWLKAVPESAKEQVVQELIKIIDEERHDADFLLTVKATLLVGRKSGVN